MWDDRGVVGVVGCECAARDAETFTTTSAFDALNRVTSSTTPDASEAIPTYDEGNLLKAVAVKIRGASTATTFVRSVTYNARGQRLAIGYAGTSSAAFTTEYAYDPLTFRITGQTTTRASDSADLQDYELIYDPAGNIVEVVDSADQTLFFSGSAPVPGVHSGVRSSLERWRAGTSCAGSEREYLHPHGNADHPLRTRLLRNEP